MTITHFRELIVAWLGGLTLAGTAQAVKWLYEIRKLRTETAEIKKRLADTEHTQLVGRLALLLLRRAECLNPNANWLTKADWAGLLTENANLIDEVLLALRRDDLVEDGVGGVLKIGPKNSMFIRRRG